MVYIVDIEAFLAAVRAGSIQGAARVLHVSRATVRRRIESLESGVGHPLLERHGEALVLTRLGVVMEREGAALLASSRRLESALRHAADDQDVSGTLKIALTPMPPASFASAFVTEVTRRWPRLRLDVCYSLRPLDELGRDADLALIVGKRPPEPWLSRVVVDLPERAVAHEDYLARAGVPESVQALSEHRLIAWGNDGRAATEWPLLDGGVAQVEPTLTFHDMRSVHDFVAAGFGIGFCAIPPGAQGWRPVLPALLGGRMQIWIVNAPAGRSSPMIRAFADALESVVGVSGMR